MKEIKETCYKGTRILLGDEKRDLINLMIDVLKKEGFVEIQIPIIQHQELFKNKVGEENNNLMYNFKDRGDRDLCLAPEYCQTKNTLISTKKGFLYFDEIGDIDGETLQHIDLDVYDDNYILNTATQFHIQGKRKCNKITLDSGLILEGTLNHKYKVLENNEVKFKTVNEIKIKDKILYSVNEYNGGEYQNLKHSYKKKKNNTSKQIIYLPNTLTEDLAWFLGLYFADGCNLNRGFHIYGNKLLKRGFKKLENILSNFNISFKYYESTNNNKCYISINCVEFIAFLKENNLLKNKSSDIDFPKLIRLSPKSVIKNFIDGYLIGDGHSYSQGIGATSISKKFINELCIIQRSLGEDGKFITQKPHKSSFGKNLKYKYWSRLGRKTTKNSRNKNFKLLNQLSYQNLLYDTVVNIEEIIENTYEISVPKGNTYLANSYVSHNTAVVQQLAKTTFKPQKNVKLFYVQECFRGEKPQAGRYRQFTQLGVEILNPEYEGWYLVNLAEKLVKLKTNKFKIELNTTRGLDYYKEGKGFEITCGSLGSSKQVCGGGEYDGGIGFAIGIDRLLSIKDEL